MPSESRPEVQGESYAVAQDDWRPEEGQAPSIWFNCPVCRTRLSGRPDEVGRPVECPDCGTKTPVPPAERSLSPPSPVTPTTTETYDLYEGEGQPPSSDRTVYGRHIAVKCSECRTRMLATEQQVGQTLICPDCGCATVVPPPGPEAAEVELTEDVYDLIPDGNYPAAGSEANRPHYAVHCPRCHTRLLATVGQVGQTMTCPDCQLEFPIPEAPPNAAPEAWREEPPAESYEVNQPAFRSDMALPDADKLAALAEGKASASPGYAPLREKPQLPRWPFFAGIYPVLVYPGVRLAWLWLSVAAAVPLFMLLQAVELAQSEGLAQIGALAMVMGTAGTTLFWLVAAAAFLLPILCETAEGSDRIENWPDAVFVDWMLQALQFVGPTFLAGIVASILDQALQSAGAAPGVGTLVGWFLAFPYFLLSVLETGSPLVPFSLPILKSFWQAWRGWLQFYLHSAAIWGVAIGLIEFVLLWQGRYFLVLVAGVVVAAMILYFRLLGRLAWYAAEQLDADEPDRIP